MVIKIVELAEVARLEHRSPKTGPWEVVAMCGGKKNCEKEETLNQLPKAPCDAGGCGEERWGVTANEHGASFWSDENDLVLGSVNVCKARKSNKTHQIVHFKMVNFMVCELYLNLKKVNVTRSLIIDSVHECDRLKHGARNQKKTVLLQNRLQFQFF